MLLKNMKQLYLEALIHNGTYVQSRILNLYHLLQKYRKCKRNSFVFAINRRHFGLSA